MRLEVDGRITYDGPLSDAPDAVKAAVVRTQQRCDRASRELDAAMKELDQQINTAFGGF